MKKRIGVWIDHERAIVVTLGEDSVTTQYIESGVVGHYRLSGGSRSRTPYGPQDIASEQKLERRYRQGLQRYYKKVIGTIRRAESIFVFGPSVARKELEKILLESQEHADRIVTAAADRMTEAQIIAKVKEHYEVSTRKPWPPWSRQA